MKANALAATEIILWLGRRDGRTDPSRLDDRRRRIPRGERRRAR
jgi:hypothetical protein